jgi:hypothetical protein
MLVLVTGTNKADAVQKWRNGKDLPIARVSNIGHALVLAERKCLAFANGQSVKGAEAIESVG